MNPKRGTFARIVQHCTSGRADPVAVAQMFQQPNHGASCHFIVGQRPEAEEPVIQVCDMGDIAWHAHSANGDSIGVEHCAREANEPSFPPGDPGLALTDAQYEKSARLNAWLLRVGGLPLSRTVIVGHSEIDSKTSHTGCPQTAVGWSWDKLMDMISRELANLGNA
jgi:N-acetyl-anhydromuramyl-L-alanine amidase AmpD